MCHRSHMACNEMRGQQVDSIMLSVYCGDFRWVDLLVEAPMGEIMRFGVLCLIYYLC